MGFLLQEDLVFFVHVDKLLVSVWVEREILTNILEMVDEYVPRLPLPFASDLPEMTPYMST